jgi:hypothetical protein
MTIMSMQEFNADRAQAGLPVLGEPLPDHIKAGNKHEAGGTLTRSPIENTEHFADPNEMRARHMAHNEGFGSASFQNVRSIDDEPNISPYLKQRLKAGIAEYANLNEQGVRTYGGYTYRRDDVYNYWSIDGVPGQFTKERFVLNRIDHLNSLKDNPELQKQLEANERLARELMLQQSQ